jgi:hypothetical protein
MVSSKSPTRHSRTSNAKYAVSVDDRNPLLTHNCQTTGESSRYVGAERNGQAARRS